MDKIEFISVENTIDGSLMEHVIIDRGNGEYTSMPKAIWDELQAKQTEGNLN